MAALKGCATRLPGRRAGQWHGSLKGLRYTMVAPVSRRSTQERQNRTECGSAGSASSALYVVRLLRADSRQGALQRALAKPLNHRPPVLRAGVDVRVDV